MYDTSYYLWLTGLSPNMVRARKGPHSPGAQLGSGLISWNILGEITKLSRSGFSKTLVLV